MTAPATKTTLCRVFYNDTTDFDNHKSAQVWAFHNQLISKWPDTKSSFICIIEPRHVNLGVRTRAEVRPVFALCKALFTKDEGLIPKFGMDEKDKDILEICQRFQHNLASTLVRADMTRGALDKIIVAIKEKEHLDYLTARLTADEYLQETDKVLMKSIESQDNVQIQVSSSGPLMVPP